MKAQEVLEEQSKRWLRAAYLYAEGLTLEVIGQRLGGITSGAAWKLKQRGMALLRNSPDLLQRASDATVEMAIANAKYRRKA
jgi:hypothetical protein